jgi:hypothetical protein
MTKQPQPDEPEDTADLPTKSPDAGKSALEQARIYDSVLAPITLSFDDGTTMDIPPNPYLRVLDDDQLIAWDKLHFERDHTYDRGPDEIVAVEEREITDKRGNVLTTIPAAAETRPGPLLFPYRRAGELITPSWEILEVIAAIGQKQYDLARSKTIDGERVAVKHFRKAWYRVEELLRERQTADPKSNGGAVDLEAVPPPDSQ